MKKFLADSALTRFKNQVGRNTFDRSKKHFASYNLGKIYPIYCQHLQANETVKIRPSQAFDMEPMTHELYNDLKCNTAWFKVYTRSLWTNYRAFSRLDPTKNSPTIVHPYISRNENWATVGSLANHLGIPVAKYGVSNGNSFSSFVYPPYEDFYNSIARSNPTLLRSGSFRVGGEHVFQAFVKRDFSTFQTDSKGTMCFQPLKLRTSLNNGTYYPNPESSPTFLDYLASSSHAAETSSYTIGFALFGGIDTLVTTAPTFTLPVIHFSGTPTLRAYLFSGSSLETAKYREAFGTFQNTINPSSSNYFFSDIRNRTAYPRQSTPNGISSPLKLSYTTKNLNISLNANQGSIIRKYQQQDAFVTIVFAIVQSSQTLDTSPLGNLGSYAGDFSIVASDATVYSVVPGIYGVPSFSSVSETSEVQNSPFEGTSPLLPINALPFRAYRNIYNSHFRDLIHDPLRDANGNIMVDQYVENMGDGADSTTSLDFEYCRFEPDLFNTCLPTPTMGDDVNRPLVGITTNMTDNVATLNYMSDGKAYSIDVNTHTEGSQTVIDDIAAVHSDNNDNFTVMTLRDAIQYGISLQDLENVRALTKWYEATYKGKGRFSYNKFIEAQFGKEPVLNENLAAEYLGGDTVYVNSMRVVNQTSDGATPLGHTGGMADFRSKNDAISCYADEDCYIMGVVWFTCDNVNSQSIDPMFYMSQPGDYGVPLFADLGVTAIPNKVVAPLQCDAAHYEDVFGYQRIYGDKIYSFDTVAGDFINLKSDYLMQRRFDSMPTLTAALSKMHPEDFTNVFCIDNSYDKIYGRWYFDITFITWLQQTPNAQII